MNPKYQKLQQFIRSSSRVLVAFSGGVDSTLVTKVSRLVLGKENVLAVTAQSESLSPSELEESKKLAGQMDVVQKIIKTRELENPDYAANPANRCFFCKTALYDLLIPMARDLGYEAVFDGTNADDISDTRPGLAAARGHGVRSPLAEAGLRKPEIRELSKMLSLPTWDKPEMACLASRIPHGEPVTAEKLAKVDQAEQIVRSFGFRQVRARHRGDAVCLEVEPGLVGRLMEDERRVPITQKILKLGFKKVSISPEGYRRHGHPS